MSEMLFAFLMGAGLFIFFGIAVGINCGKSNIEGIVYAILTMLAGGIGSMILCGALGL